MKCNIVEKRDFIFVEIGGSLNKSVPCSARDILHPWRSRTGPKIVVDLGGIDEDGDMVAQLAVITAFKKEVDLMNGFLKICSLRPRIKNYLLKNRLDRIFDIYEDLNSAEKSLWERRRYGKNDFVRSCQSLKDMHFMFLSLLAREEQLEYVFYND